MNKLHRVLLLCTFVSISPFASAALITVASDNASNYGNAWAGNGGGVADWQFADFQAGGAAGTFLAQSQGDLNNIDTADKGWGTFANDGGQNNGGFNQSVAFRGFAGNSLDTMGDQLQVSLEHGAIIAGGSVGFNLRNQNNNLVVGDYNALSRLEFSFVGGTNSYSIFDGNGQVDTGIGFTDAGLDIQFSLLSADTYQFQVFNAQNSNLLVSFSGDLAGSGSIDSIALFNRNAELGNAYFNSLSILEEKSLAVPEPHSALLFLVGFGALLRRRK
jgi:hypothetical protein